MPRTLAEVVFERFGLKVVREHYYEKGPRVYSLVQCVDPDPDSQRPHSVWYRTGKYGNWRWRNEALQEAYISGIFDRTHEKRIGSGWVEAELPLYPTPR